MEVEQQTDKRRHRIAAVTYAVLAMGVFGILLFLFITVIWNMNECSLRNPYTLQPVESVVSNPYFQSTGVLMRPPPSRHITTPSWLNSKDRYQPPYTQVAAFPIIERNMSRDSAFIPIPKSTSMFVQMAEAIWQAPVTAMSSPSWGAPVVSYQEVPYALRSMFSSLASMISFAGPMGMVPNLPMCLKGSLEGAQNVVDTISSYPRLSQCANVGLQQQVRVQSSHLTTMGIFSSIHINFLLLTVTWIYMSYTLLKMVDHWAEYKDNSFKYGIIINYAIYAWNIIFSIICVVFLLVPDTQNIPPNNLLIGAVGTMVAFLHQYFVISGNDANGDRLTDQRSQIKPFSIASSSSHHYSPVGVTFRGAHPMQEKPRFSNINLRGPLVADDQRYGYLTADNPEDNSSKMGRLYSSAFVTSPIFFVCILAASNPTIPLWSLRITFVTMMCTIILLVPAFKMNNNEWRNGTPPPGYNTLFRYCKFLVVGASVFAFASFSMIFFKYSSFYATQDSLVGAIVFMPYIYKTIYLVVSWIMIIMDKGWSKWLIVVFQVFDLVMFLVISSVLADSAANGKLFSYKCTPWARF